MKSDIIIPIDKQHLSIDFDELNILQTAMVLPKRGNIVALKKRIPLPLSVQEIIQDMQSPHSPLHKYINAMIMSQLIRYEILMDEENAREAFIHAIAVREQEARLIFRQKLRAYLRRRSFIYREEKLAEMMRKVAEINQLKLPEVIALKHYLLEASRYADLSYYSRFASDRMTANMIQDLINQRYQRADHNFQRLDHLLQRPNLSPAQREEGVAIMERLIRRNELLAPENVEKNLPHLDFYDPVMLGQHLRGLGAQEELYEKKIERVNIFEQSFLKSTPDHREININVEDNSLEQKNEILIAKIEAPSQEIKWQDRIFQNKLNDELERMFNGGVIVGQEYGVLLDAIYNLQKLTNANSCDVAARINLAKLAASLIDKIDSDNEAYQGVLGPLNHWASALPEIEKVTMDKPMSNMTREIAIQENSNVVDVVRDEQVAYQGVKNFITELMQNSEGNFHAELEILSKLLHPKLDSDAVRAIIDQYNKMSLNFPEEEMMDIYLELHSLSFLDKIQTPDDIVRLFSLNKN
jgi:hypothetical protein